MNDLINGVPDEYLPPKRILLVEDHIDTLKVLARLLECRGFKVTPVSTVQAGREAAFEGRFDVVVADIGLPDGSGYDLMSELKTKYSVKGVALSGYGSADDVAQSREAGFLVHLTKPVSVHQIETAVMKVIEGLSVLA